MVVESETVTDCVDSTLLCGITSRNRMKKCMLQTRWMIVDKENWATILSWAAVRTYLPI